MTRSKPPRRTKEPVEPAVTFKADIKPVRLQKIMASAGLGSRRALEQRIKSGEVYINGAAASIGQVVSNGDKVGLDGKEWKVIDIKVTQRSLVYNKPIGEVTTRSDPPGPAHGIRQAANY